MASITQMETKTGKRFFKISVSRGHGITPYTMRWYWPDGWSKKAAEREVNKVALEFEQKCKAGEVLSRAESKAKAAQEAVEAAKIKTLNQYVNQVWFPAKDVVIAEGTRSNYACMLNHHVLPELGEVPITDITPAMLTALILKLSGDLAYATVSKIYKIIGNIFEMATFDDTLSLNPMSKVRPPVRRKDELIESEVDKAYDAGELAHILECIKSEPLMWQAYIHFASDTGCRRGEVAGLQWTDIDFTDGECEISRNLQYTPSKGIYVDTPKNGKKKVIDLGSETLRILREWRQEQAGICVSKWVFATSPEPINPQSVNKAFKRIGERHGFKNFHPHILRHTSASLSLANGADVVAVSRRLGHSEPGITLNVYAHATQEGVRRAGELARQAVKAASKKE